ncbi:MAG: DUF2283 domain-containing protein [Nanoarchaeota archaeon]
MRIEYDKDVDCAYIYLDGSIQNGESKKTIEINDNIIVDLNADGQLIGIEVLDASKVLSKKALIGAESAR